MTYTSHRVLPQILPSDIATRRAHIAKIAARLA
jgi:hypothetical protein